MKHQTYAIGRDLNRIQAGDVITNEAGHAYTVTALSHYLDPMEPAQAFNITARAHSIYGPQIVDLIPAQVYNFSALRMEKVTQ